ncbi:MAG: DegV family EDD domain-containing protein, partial [Lachnospiraceae bacterium]|nr:DegV family EDD domain-containing protein [Lachnospiraceae bacterium]
GKMEIVPVTYEVGRMLSDIVNMIWVRAKEKGLEFHVDVDKTVPAQLIGDEVRIKQILVNVLNNAVKYTETGSVTLSIHSREDSSEYVHISFSVTDTGMGIKQEDIEHLFSAFQRVDEEENRHIEGTGLGLSIVKQLVEMMGGNITVDSVYTKGSTFEITLPQKRASEEKIGEFNLETRHDFGAREYYKQSFEAPKAHVLIVDDDETNLMVAEKLLRETKVQIDTAASGEECLKKTLTARYDVIFMDHLMPGMNGIECLHAIRNQTGGLNLDTHVVVLTANAGRENQALYRREGFDGYLPKPVNGAQLEEELLKHLPKEVVRMRRADDSVGVIETPVPVHKKKKLPVMITAGSVCDLPEKFVEKYQITIMPYRILTEKGDFLDGVETDTDGILSYMNEVGKSIRSEEPEVEDMKDFFAEQLTKAGHIVHIAMTKYSSAGYERVLEASKAFDNVSVIDSGHLSCGMGLLVLRAAEYAAGGMSADEIVKKIEEMKTQVSTSFLVDSTEYMARSGMIASKIDRLCDALMFHPVLMMKKSRIKVGSIRVGTKETVWRKYINSTLDTAGVIDTSMLFIAYAGLSEGELEDIRQQVEKKVEFRKVVCQKASPVIATNCGPGSFGLMFMMKK